MPAVPTFWITHGLRAHVTVCSHVYTHGACPAVAVRARFVAVTWLVYLIRVGCACRVVRVGLITFEPTQLIGHFRYCLDYTLFRVLDVALRLWNWITHTPLTLDWLHWIVDFVRVCYVTLHTHVLPITVTALRCFTLFDLIVDLRVSRTLRYGCPVVTHPRLRAVVCVTFD